MTELKIVAIHQPNFFPWLGYYDKIARCDAFILLDNVQFPKTGGTWSNRVRILVNGQPAWLTMPIVRAYHGVRRITEMEINDSVPWREKIIKTLQANYTRAPYFKELFQILEALVNNPTNSLCTYNIHAITVIADLLGLDTGKLILGSRLQVNGQATDLLIEMTRAVGGAAYLCGGGADGYQEDEKFSAAGLKLIYQNFAHPVYPQMGPSEFFPGFSILDVLLNCGIQGTRSLLRIGER
jgi:hypothetical protein